MVKYPLYLNNLEETVPNADTVSLVKVWVGQLFTGNTRVSCVPNLKIRLKTGHQVTLMATNYTLLPNHIDLEVNPNLDMNDLSFFDASFWRALVGRRGEGWFWLVDRNTGIQLLDILLSPDRDVLENAAIKMLQEVEVLFEAIEKGRQTTTEKLTTSPLPDISG